jgi:pectate lyase
MLAADGFGRNAIGGTGGASITVTNAADLIAYASSSLPYIITISGTITLNGNLLITSNKTVQGSDSSSTIIGDLTIGSGVNNVIVRYLNFTNPASVGWGDGVTIRDGAKNIFVTHCTFTDCADGELDVSTKSDSVTISWCRFRYVTQTAHRNVMLIGSDDAYTADLGYLHVTVHHCWFDQLCTERMPSVRFGRVHVYNNYYSAAGNSYCVRTRLYAECLVENNYFENVQNPWELLTTTGTPGKIHAANNSNSFLDTTHGVTWLSGWYPGQSLVLGTDTVFSPPYSFVLTDVQFVKDTVMKNAGNRGIRTPDAVRESGFTASGFSFFPNFPNPFNSMTSISFSLPTKLFVSLTIVDMLGRAVASLASETLPAGNHSRRWNAAGVPSGAYVCRLQAGGFYETRKLIVLK